MGSALNKRGWNAAAGVYAGRSSVGSGRDDLCYPLLPPIVEGLRILDAGCGMGWLSRFLAERGASVVGVDVSDELIARAQAAETESPLGISYLVHDLLEPLPFDDGAFDIAISVMTVMDAEDPLAAVRNVGRVVWDGGQLVFSLLHPCFYRPKTRATQWGTEIDVEHYFDRNRIEGRYIERDGKRVEYRQFHRTLGDYLNALPEASFCVEQFVEPGDTRLAISARKCTGRATLLLAADHGQLAEGAP